LANKGNEHLEQVTEVGNVGDDLVRREPVERRAQALMGQIHFGNKSKK
jgi:hypothetical protein